MYDFWRHLVVCDQKKKDHVITSGRALFSPVLTLALCHAASPTCTRSPLSFTTGSMQSGSQAERTAGETRGDQIVTSSEAVSAITNSPDETEEKHKRVKQLIQGRDVKQIMAERQKSLAELEKLLKDWERRSHEEEEKQKEEEAKIKEARKKLRERERTVEEKEQKQKEMRQKLGEKQEQLTARQKSLEEAREKLQEKERMLERKQRRKEQSYFHAEQGQQRKNEGNKCTECSSNSKFKTEAVDWTFGSVDPVVGSHPVVKPRSRCSLSPRISRSISPGSSTDAAPVASVLTKDGEIGGCKVGKTTMV